MSPTPSEKHSILLMLASVLLFAANVLMIRALALHVPAADGWVASLFRGVVGLIIVAAFFGRRGLELAHLFSRPLLIFRGILGGLGILMFYITVVHLGAGRATIINLSYPIFGSLFAALWLKEVLPGQAWGWMIAGFAGLVVFLGSGFGEIGGGIGRYDLLALLGAVAAGGVVTLIRQLRHTEHTATIYAAQCSAGVLFAAWPAGGPTLSLPPVALGLLTLAAVIVAGGQLAMTHAFRTLSVSKGSSIQMLLPLITAIGGHFLFQESFTAVEIGGAALTLFATWQVIRNRATRQLVPPIRPA